MLYRWRGCSEAPVDLERVRGAPLGGLRGARPVPQALPDERWPKESDVRFLAALIASGTLADTPGTLLTCPGQGSSGPEGVDYRSSRMSADSVYAA
jgi:hypothetical protein